MTCPDPHEDVAVAEPPSDTHNREVRAVLLRRIASPSYLLLALLMFPLPWVKVQCAHDEPAASPLLVRARPGKLSHRLLPRSDTETLVSQSGLQAALGTCSIPDPGQDSTKKEKELAAHMSASPLMAAWGALVLGGWLAGFLLPLGRLRLAAVGACAAAAVLLLAAQVHVGFPIETALEDGGAGPPPAEPARDTGRDGAFYSAYTPWLFVAALSPAWALLLTGLEWRRDRRRRRAEGLAARPACEPDSPVRSP